MTSLATEVKRVRQHEQWIRVLAAELRFKLNLVNPPYEAVMECKEAFVRIRQLLMTVCELYEVKEQYWKEVDSLQNAMNLPGAAAQVLDARHHALNESIFKHLQEIEKLTEFLSPEAIHQVNGYVDNIRPYLDKCVPRITGSGCPSTGAKHENPQLWYRAQQPDLSTSLTTMYSEVIIRQGGH